MHASGETSRPLVALLTDFGPESWYAGAVKGALLSTGGELLPVDITHGVPAQNILAGAIQLAASRDTFPPGTVFLAVVDPGVGGERRGLAMKVGDHYFVGPDNGLFGEVLLRAGGDESIEIVHLDRPELWRETVSPTFHGRDVFAPVAALLAGGMPLADCGSSCDDPVPLDRPFCAREGDELLGQVLLVDGFGNLTSNILAQDLASFLGGADPARLCVALGEHRLSGLLGTYADAPADTALCLLGSAGFLEVAVVGGSAHRRLGCGPGEWLRVSIDDSAEGEAR